MARAARPRLQLTSTPPRAAYAPAIPAARFSLTKAGVIAGMISFCTMFWAAIIGAAMALA